MKKNWALFFQHFHFSPLFFFLFPLHLLLRFLFLWNSYPKMRFRSFHTSICPDRWRFAFIRHSIPIRFRFPYALTSRSFHHVSVAYISSLPQTQKVFASVAANTCFCCELMQLNGSKSQAKRYSTLIFILFVRLFFIFFW